MHWNVTSQKVTANIRKKRKNHDMGQSKGSKKSKERTRESSSVVTCGKFGLGVQVWVSRDANVFEASVAHEKSHSGWNRLCICLLVRNEKLQPMQNSECWTSEKQFPKCAVLVRGSAKSRAKSWCSWQWSGGDMNHHEGCGTKPELESNGV